jgi:hypothetical protein
MLAERTLENTQTNRQGGRTCGVFLWKFIMAELTLLLVRA